MNKAPLPLGPLEPLGLEESGGVGALSIKKDPTYGASPAPAQDLVGHDRLRVLENDELYTARDASVAFGAPHRVSYPPAAHEHPAKLGKHCRSLPACKRNRVLRAYLGWTPLAIRATPRCRNPDPVIRLEPVDRPAVDRSTRAPSLKGAGS